ncbi:unnamed protein product [Ectocarpus sp. 6 AP-2014]
MFSTAARTLHARHLRAPVAKTAAALAGAAGAAALFHNTSSSSFRSTAAMAEATDSSKTAFSPKEFRDFPLREIEEMTHNVRRFRIGLPSEEHVMGMKTASCIVVKGKGKDGSVAVRPYTPTTTNDTKGHFDLVIKVYPEGNVSSHLFSLKVGDTVAVKGPFPKFDYSPNVKKEIGMIAGGTGITPMLQVLQELLLNPEDKTKVTLLFANVTAADIMLKAEIDKLAAEHDNFDVVYVVSGQGGGGVDGADGTRQRLPDRDPSTQALRRLGHLRVRTTGHDERHFRAQERRQEPRRNRRGAQGARLHLRHGLQVLRFEGFLRVSPSLCIAYVSHESQGLSSDDMVCHKM